MGEVIKKLDQITPQAFIDSKVVKADVGVSENLGIEWKTGGSNNLGSLSASSRPTSFPWVASASADPNDSVNHFLQQFVPVTATSTTVSQNTNNPRNFPFPALSASGGGFEFGTLDFTDFNIVLQMLRARSNTKVVSNPRIVVLNNQSAKVQVGSDIPLPTFERNETTGSVEVTGFTYREVGVVLNVTPHINSEEEILVDLKPEVSSRQANNVDFGDFQAPAFDVTKAETQVLIRSGETIAIGGLLTDAVGIAESKVPYLSDIPILGKLFRSKRQTAGTGNSKVETLFFVTVTMVDSEGQPTGELADKKGGAKQAASGEDQGRTSGKARVGKSSQGAKISPSGTALETAPEASPTDSEVAAHAAA